MTKGESNKWVARVWPTGVHVWGLLTLFHKLDCEAGAVGAHEWKHAHNHDKHPRAEHRRGHYQQLLNVGQQVPWRNFLQQVLLIYRYMHISWGAGKQMEEIIPKQQTWCFRYKPLHAESCPPVWQNRDKCFRRIFYPEREFKWISALVNLYNRLHWKKWLKYYFKHQCMEVMIQRRIKHKILWTQEYSSFYGCWQNYIQAVNLFLHQ